MVADLGQGNAGDGFSRTRWMNVWSWVRRRWLPLGLAAAVFVAALAIATMRLFVWPATDAVRPVDAVVIFAGGRGERLDLAERLMNDGVAADLIIPNGMAVEWPDGIRACTETRAYDVHCLRPSPDTTRGEARAIAGLAEQEGWNTLLVVTSSYHLSRAGLLLDRCFDGEVLTVSAQPELGPFGWARRIGHEWVASTEAVVVQRSC